MNAQKTKGEITNSSLELLYEVSREFASALDLRTVLHRVLFLSMKNIGAVSGSIIVLDDTGQPVESALLTPGKKHQSTTHQLRVTYEQGLAGWVARNRLAVLISDTSKDERWLRRPDDDISQTGPKSAISVPILAREKLVGVITLVHPEPGFFKPAHLELVRAIADQAGISIQNARLYSDSQRQAQVMSALAESAAAITSSLHLDIVLKQILDQVCKALSAEGAFIALSVPETKVLEIRATTFKPSRTAIGMQISLGRGIAGWVAEHGQGLVVSNPSGDPRFDPAIDQPLKMKCHSILSAPIQTGEQVVGVLQVINPTESLSDSDDISILTGVANLAGTAIRHAQLFESLQTAHRRYQELFEDSIDPILITDLEGKILEVNRQAITATGLKKHQLLSLSIGDLHKINTSVVGSRFEKLDSGKTLFYESQLAFPTSRPFFIQIYVHSTQYEGKKYLKWVFRDISERKDLDKLREDLTAMVYHDLRAPLTNISSSLDMLKPLVSNLGDPNVESLLNIAARSTNRLHRLTSTLLDINRLEAGQSISDCHPEAVSGLIQEALEVVLPFADSREIKLEVNLPPDLPPIRADADMIRRVLINLLDNAIKFSPFSGKVVIGAKQEDNNVHVWVEDFGPGILPTDQDRIFEKFTRIQGSKGIGLGLAFCRLAVLAHGGRIWVDSKVGVGSCFHFTIPAATTNQVS